MGFTQTPVTNQLTSHSYLTLSHRVHTHLSKHWAHTYTDAQTVTWESHRHPHRSMGSPRYPHFLMGDTQKPLSKVWAHIDTHTFSRGSHRHPLTNDWAHTDTQHFLTYRGHIDTSHKSMGSHRYPTFSWGSNRHPSLIIGLTQVPIFSHGDHTDTPHLLLGSHRYPHFLMHGGHTDTPR